MWFRVDDSFADHPKVLCVSTAAVGLWTKAGAWSARHLTDGRVPRTALAALGGTTTQAGQLVQAGLWDAVEDGWRFHDWGDYQPTGTEIDGLRGARRTGAQRTNHDRWHVRRGLTDPACPYCKGDEA